LIVVTTTMACEGVQILGDMGSGKTSGSGKALAKAMLKAGFGGLVLCKKTDECASWIRYARETGREDQLLIVHPSQKWRFNFLEYSFTRAGEGAGYVPNAINLMLNLIENRRERSGGATQRQEAFWIENARRMLRYTMEALILAGEPVTMDGLKRKARQNILYTSAEINRPESARYSSTPCARVQTAIIARLEKVIEPDA
jgi:hypothetical protein